MQGKVGAKEEREEEGQGENSPRGPDQEVLVIEGPFRCRRAVYTAVITVSY